MVICHAALVQTRFPLTIGRPCLTMRADAVHKDLHMSFFNHRFTAATVLAMSTASTAYADVSAQDVWTDWKSYFEGLGYGVSASEAQSGNTLTITDLTIDIPQTEDMGASSMRLDQVAFSENADGTVSVVFPEVMPFAMQVTGEEGEVADVELEVRHTGMVSTVSGVPTEMTNAYKAQTVEVMMTGLTVDGEVQSPDMALVKLAMQGLSGTTKTTIGGKRVYDQSMQAGDVTYDLAFADPEGSGNAKMNGRIDGLNFTGTSAFPLVKIDTGDVSSLLAAGVTGEGTFNYTGGASDISVEENGASAFSATTTSNGGSLDVALGEDGLNYAGDQKNLQVAMMSPDFPVPIEFDMVDARFNLAMPLQKTEEMKDFAFGFAFNDFSMSDMLWGMFDPNAQLPRDPATIVLDLTGKARMLFDFLDPSAATVSGDPNITPAEVEQVNINRLQVKAAGAELTGEGAFRFDNAAPGGALKPIGAADLSLVGGNKLIDSLVAMGLLPEDQAMGARMMLGLLAVPGNAPDTLNSRIETNEQGHILANGQRIQ